MRPTPDELPDLSKLADGSLDAARRDEVRARIERSPELSASYERERRVVALLHESRATERAPAALRARIEGARPSPAVRTRRRLGYAGGLSAALAAIVLVLVLALPGGSPGAPSLSQAAALAVRGPAAAAPAPDPDAPQRQLGQSLEQVYFPNWMTRFGWRAVGQRTDRLDGRRAVTVYYEWHGQRIAYTIVGAPALNEPAVRVTQLNGVQLRTLRLGGRLVVTWQRDGHTCVLSGAAVSPAELRHLAAWKG
jgi:anti-sigma factor RsiW